VDWGHPNPCQGLPPLNPAQNNLHIGLTKGNSEGITKEKPMKIGLLEDNQAIVDWMTTALAMAGHVVYSYSEGASFLEGLLPGRGSQNHLPFELAIVDLHLPGEMSGREVIARIRQTLPARILPIIVVTGASQSELANVQANFPEVPILRKPFKMQALLRLLATSRGANGSQEASISIN